MHQPKAANRLANRLLTALEGHLDAEQEDFLELALALAMTEGLPPEDGGDYAVAAMSLWYGAHFPCLSAHEGGERQRQTREHRARRAELGRIVESRRARLDRGCERRVRLRTPSAGRPRRRGAGRPRGRSSSRARAPTGDDASGDTEPGESAGHAARFYLADLPPAVMRAYLPGGRHRRLAA